MTDPSEQERFMSSVITKLESSDYSKSAALAHAYALRAKAYLEMSEWALAIQNAQQATALVDIASAPTVTMAYRSWVDALEGQGQHARDVVPVLQAWFKAQPKFGTKIKNEIESWVERAQ